MQYIKEYFSLEKKLFQIKYFKQINLAIDNK